MTVTHGVALSWLQLVKGGKWHAWPRGGRQSMCGKMNVEHLRQAPAYAITQQTPAVTEPLCTLCVKKSGLSVAIASAPDATAMAWVGFLKRYCARIKITVADNATEILAARLAEVGPPDDAEAQLVFTQIRDLILRPMRIKTPSRRGGMATVQTIPHLRETLAALPPNTKALQQVAAALRCWRTITKQDLSTNKFKPAHVISTMLQVPSPEAYIKHLAAKGMPHLALIFHPNTLARAQKDTALRGVFSGSDTYWAATKAQLNVLEDDPVDDPAGVL